ncbi:MAG: Ldh family oxidoreductase, partial [Chloroflexi bacterium]|nr:Ldh family oxidoreductase [Chloroflexota bacterium]
MAGQEVRIEHNELRRFCAELLEAVGVPAQDAALTATIQVEADLRGVYSHGSRAIPRYVRNIRHASTNPRAHITITKEGPAYALLDGDYGLGQVVAYKAMELAIQKADEATVAAVGVQRSSHFGAAAYYTVMAAEAGMIGFATSVGGSANQAAYGGRNPVLGNSPLSYAIPAGEEPPIVLDMATGLSAHGKIPLARMAGELLPAGYFMTREGEDTRDPAVAAVVMPTGGPKGFGLALTMDTLAGIMLGDVAACHKNRREPDEPLSAGHFFLAIRVASFRPLDEFKAEIDRQIRTIRAST